TRSRPPAALSRSRSSVAAASASVRSPSPLRSTSWSISRRCRPSCSGVTTRDSPGMPGCCGSTARRRAPSCLRWSSPTRPREASCASTPSSCSVRPCCTHWRMSGFLRRDQGGPVSCWHCLCCRPRPLPLQLRGGFAVRLGRDPHPRGGLFHELDRRGDLGEAVRRAFRDGLDASDLRLTCGHGGRDVLHLLPDRARGASHGLRRPRRLVG